MKNKCAGCNEKTITFKTFYFSSGGIMCPKCKAVLQKKQYPFLYWFLVLTSFSIWMLISKYFIRNGINRYLSIPILLIMIFVSLHFSTHTAIKKASVEKFKFKELLITFFIIYPLLLMLMKIFNF